MGMCTRRIQEDLAKLISQGHPCHQQTDGAAASQAPPTLLCRRSLILEASPVSMVAMVAALFWPHHSRSTQVHYNFASTCSVKWKTTLQQA